METKIFKVLSSLVLLCSIFYLQGCGNSDVNTVKKAVLQSYPDAQIGPVLKANFTNIRWTSSNKNGKNCVTFTGKISKATHEKLAKILDVGNQKLDFIFMSVSPELYKNSEDQITKKYQGEIDSLNKQSLELDKLIEKLDAQESELTSAKSDFMIRLDTKYGDPIASYKISVKQAESYLQSAKEDLQRHKNTPKEKHFTEVVNMFENELKEARKELKDEEEKTERAAKGYKEWQDQGNEAKIKGLSKKIETLKNNELAISGKIRKIDQGRINEINKMKESVRAEIIGKYFWTENDLVEIEFVVHPEGNIEIKEMKGNSWNKFGLSIADILDGIYK